MVDVQSGPRRTSRPVRPRIDGRAGCKMVGDLFGVSTSGGDGGSTCVILTGGSGRLRIDGTKTGFGLNATTYSSVSLRAIPAQSEITLSTFSSVRCGARSAATVRLIRLSANATSN